MSRGDGLGNPLNIEATSDSWLGEVSPSRDVRFSEFVDPWHGIRAGAKIVLNGAKRGRVTVRDIVARWAPPSENATEKYIAFVADFMGVGNRQVLDLRDHFVLCELLTAMIKFEQGYCNHSDQLIEDAALAALKATA